MRTSIIWGAALLALCLTSACQPLPAKTTPATTPAPLASSAAASVASAASSAAATTGQTAPSALPLDLKQVWQKSKHANSFVASADGNNNDCSRCHAPMNWLPTSMNEIPVTCQSCKFNISTPKPIAKADWKNVGCEQCHKTDKDGVTKQIAWLDATIAQFDTNADPYQPVKSSTALCVMCHRDATKIDLGKTAHASMGCTNCHDPHSTAATCTNSQCHTNALKPAKPIAGHDAAHANVTCVACHDANGWKAQPADNKTWVTFRPTNSLGDPKPMPFTSHNLQKTVDCARCHFGGNPWNLKTVSQ